MVIYIAAFTAGFIVMTVEIAAGRIIAPLFGVSLYTWTSVIGVILLGISLGNYIGGVLADRVLPRKALGYLFFLSGVFIALVPKGAEILPGLLNFAYGFVANIVFATVFLFFLPAFLLGTIFPLVVKVRISDTIGIGKEVGVISALGAAGSIAGTFVTGFFFIGKLGSFLTFQLCAALLIGLAFVFLRPRTIFLICAVGVLVAAFGVTRGRSKSHPLFKKESSYYAIRVEDRGGLRWLFLDADAHSVETKDGGSIPVPYIRMLARSGEAYASLNGRAPRRILILGGGSYALAKSLSASLPASRVDVVEIDPKVTATAERFFELAAYPIRVIHGDARLFLNQTSDRYDLIVGDAYNSFISVPWQLTTQDFAEKAQSRLSPGGMYLVNFISETEGSGSIFFRSFAYTVSSVFGSVYAIPISGSAYRGVQNIVLVAFLDQDAGRVARREAISRLEAALASQAKAVDVASLDLSSAMLFTDDFAPVERLMLPSVKSYFPTYFAFLADRGLR